MSPVVPTVARQMRDTAHSLRAHDGLRGAPRGIVAAMSTPTDQPTPDRASRRPLLVGFQLPEIEREVRWPEIRRMVETAEGIGLDSVWTGDHLLYRRPGQPPAGPWEAWSVLAAVAAVTDRLLLGPLVAATSFHNPGMLAKKAAAVDEISGGRLILGLGAGWNETEYRAFGFPFDQRVARFEEAFTIIRTLLRDGAIDFQGRFYEARDLELLPRPHRAGGPPILIGSSGERMLRLTMPYADAWNAWYATYGNTPSGIAAQRDLVDAACRDVGRDAAEVERTVAVLVALPGGRGRTQGDYASDEPRGVPVDRLADHLRALATEGIRHVQLVLDPITVPSIERLAPVLRDLDA
jgi:alkanesulfonate monooxygenase SsuD/methylene tetrahydromethanopterin reductase-like flavin-dependent oxidoreductase (luciferase family)